MGSYSKLLEKSPRKTSHDTASLLDEMSYQDEIFPPSPRHKWKKWFLVGLFASTTAVYICGSLAFMTLMYRRGEFHLRAPDPPYSA
jgi:hypothetical protein